ncbi:receptor like protein 21-like [Camellia sinensis]|uniref:receptor like protein 21-like n=1 Tax=Camellia sinensis TaxID=4442 RepID=UPI0010368150|nr:receptor like protein 21-like [Camellia sinensis]
MLATCTTQSNGGCLEGERRGLLEFKDFLKSNGADADRILPTWVEKPADHHLNECCDWERVTCDPTTGHVTELSLHNIRDISGDEYFYRSSGFFGSEVDFKEYHQNRIWFINVSVFLPFEELRNLNLSYNLFSGWIDNQGFEGLSSLRKLEKLDLGSNLFNDSNIFRCLGALASIKTLIFSYNSLGGYFPAHGTFSNIEKLGNAGYRQQSLSWLSPNASWLVNFVYDWDYCQSSSSSSTAIAIGGGDAKELGEAGDGESEGSGVVESENEV